MVIDIVYPSGATPLDPDEIAGLIPTHISKQRQLNEWELSNILEGERWAFSRRNKNILTNEFVCQMHKKLFGDTWRWAGKFRITEKNIGLEPQHIQAALHDLCEDAKAQLAYKSFSLDELAARFSHRLVAIHPFANGNGRLSRSMADLLLVQNGGTRFTWGASNLTHEGEVRTRYLTALRAADRKDYAPLLAFVRS